MSNISPTEAMTTPAIDGHAADAGAEAADPLQLVSFVVGAEEFAIEILAVQEIVRMMPITEVPHSPAEVEGVVNLRGQITPVVDLRKRFGLEAREKGAEARIIVVEVSGQVLGFIVDRVNEVLRIDANIVEPAPSVAISIDSDYVRGVGKLDDRLLILLQLERLFDAEQARETRQSAEDDDGDADRQAQAA